MSSLSNRNSLENAGTSGAAGSILFSCVTGLGGYAFGRQHGYNDGHSNGYDLGYQQAKAEDAAVIRQQQLENARLQADNSQLIADKGRLETEVKVLKALLKEQPTTPQAEAILKSLDKVQLRLTELLPPIYDDGQDHQTRLN